MFDLITNLINNYAFNVGIMAGSIILTYLVQWQASSTIKRELASRNPECSKSIDTVVLKRFITNGIVLFPLFVFDYSAWIFVAAFTLSMFNIAYAAEAESLDRRRALFKHLRLSNISEAIPHIIVSILSIQWLEVAEVSTTISMLVRTYSLILILIAVYKILAPWNDSVFFRRAFLVGRR